MTRWRVSDELKTELPPISRVVIRTVAGEVTVAAGNAARIDVRRDSGAEAVVEVVDGTLYVSQPEEGEAPLGRLIKMFTEGRRHRCTVAVVAPPDASIDVATVSADVVASGLAGGSRVKTVSGDVTLSGLSTEVDVKTVSGDVEAKELAGELKLKTVSGDIGVVDGACRWVDAKTVSGDVLLDLELDPQGTYDLSTVSGDVGLRTSADPSLRVDATSVSGDLTSDFGLGWEQVPGRRRVSETLGEGGARLWVKTVSGHLRVLRRREAA